MGRDVYAQAETRVGLSDEGSVAMDLELSRSTDDELGRLAEEIHGTKTDVFKWGLALLSLAVDAKKRGKRLAIVDASGHIDTEITGL